MSIAERFPTLTNVERKALVATIDAMNTVSAYSFCNSTTSQDACEFTMRELLFKVDGDSDAVIAALNVQLQKILERKRASVAWKLQSVRRAYESSVLPALRRHGVGAAQTCNELTND
ncbi:MAG: hypothetical protein H7Z40_07155 [Phycisphaerae bacterium]|nr:hypothetical protein [Gemmatimonadaceae bacterium]